MRLLDITRLESGAIEPHLVPVSLASIYADLQREFEPVALAKGLQLEFAATSRVVTSDQNIAESAAAERRRQRTQVHREGLRESGRNTRFRRAAALRCGLRQRHPRRQIGANFRRILSSRPDRSPAIRRRPGACHRSRGVTASWIFGDRHIGITAAVRRFACAYRFSKSAPMRPRPSTRHRLPPPRTQPPLVGWCCWRTMIPCVRPRSSF